MTRPISVRRLRGAAVCLLVGVLLCGCSTLPDSGEVHTRPAGAGETAGQPPYFAPPGPSVNDSQEGIVRGFLLAMQANPPSTAVARSFLSNRAKATWNPNQGTIVYDASTVERTGGQVDQVSVRLRGAHRLSPQGAWLDGTTASTTTVPLTLVREQGEWRIDNPPNVLAVPASYFSSLFVPFNVYFFDRTGTVLVPTTVYVPRGEQTGTNLVRGLLAGPPRVLRDVAVSAFPSQPDLDLAGVVVVVNDAGIAEVPLGSAVLKLAPADLNRMVIQLAWTLRQVPGINRLRITVDGAPVSLSDGRTDVSVTEGEDYDPVVAPQRDLLAIAGGRVVHEDGSAVSGPFGQAGFALRSLAWNARGHALAAVTQNGRQVLVAPDRGERSASRVRTVLAGARSVLRPAYDRFGGLWLVDDSRTGAVVHLRQGRRDKIVRIPGVSGRRISAFTVTRDGTRLVAVLANSTNPTVEVSNLVRDPRGRLRRALPARTLQVSGADLGPGRDLVQSGATSVAVLTSPPTGSDDITPVELDGSPGPDESQGAIASDVPHGDLAGLVASPDPVLALGVVSADHRLFTFAAGGGWTRSKLSAVVAATYAQ